jgi:hypothetical protein
MSRTSPVLLRIAGTLALMAATIGPLLVGFGRMITLLSLARSAAILAGTSFASLGTILAIGAPVLIGLAALGYFLLKAAEAAAKAKQANEDFTASLATKSLAQLKAAQTDLAVSIKSNQNTLHLLQRQNIERHDSLAGVFRPDDPKIKQFSDLIKQQQNDLGELATAIANAGKAT